MNFTMARDAQSDAVGDIEAKRFVIREADDVVGMKGDVMRATMAASMAVSAIHGHAPRRELWGQALALSVSDAALPTRVVVSAPVRAVALGRAVFGPGAGALERGAALDTLKCRGAIRPAGFAAEARGVRSVGMNREWAVAASTRFGDQNDHKADNIMRDCGSLCRKEATLEATGQTYAATQAARDRAKPGRKGRPRPDAPGVAA